MTLKKEKEKEKFNKDYSQTTLELNVAEVETRLKSGCECKVSCFEGFDPEMVFKHRLNIADLTKNEQDFYVMGIVRSSLMDRSEKGAKRQRKRSSYSYHGKKVCLFAFLYLENITIYQLKKIRSHVMVNGVVAIQHGNSHKIPHNAFPLDLYKRVENFLRRYLNADKQPSNKSIVVKEPLSKVYQEYKNHDKGAEQYMGYTTFRTFFKKQFPQVRLSTQSAKPQASTTSSSCQIQVVEEQQYQVIKQETVYNTPISNTDDLIYYESEVSREEEVLDEDAHEESFGT